MEFVLEMSNNQIPHALSDQLYVKKRFSFTSERLGFRNWIENDRAEFALLNADPEVMAHFPNTLTTEASNALLDRLQDHFEHHGYTYFAVEILETGAFIGFIGMAYQDYESAVTPATDIGWRLKKSAWGKGYATEGAKRCLKYAFEEHALERIIATCTLQNKSSENVMQKIGMTRKGKFDHPKLENFPALKTCLWYEIKNVDFPFY